MGNLLTGVSFKEPTTVEECDSTWDTDSAGEEEQGEDEEEAERDKKRSGGEDESGPGGTDASHQKDCSTTELNIKPKRSFYAARDLYKYRHQYPQNFKDLRCQNDLCNLSFYMNDIPFKPDGVLIEDILNKWKGDYDKLEHNHTYIQWLFPLREQGLNFYAKELTSYEIEEFKKTKEAMKRFISAYKIMLDFFGLKLVDKDGNVSRAANWQVRFQHLNESQHNYLRITRILKSLGELGYENFKFPLVKAFLEESIVENTIPNMKQSALEYFVYTIKDRRERRKLLRFASHHYQPPEHFIWGPAKGQKYEQNKILKKASLNRSLRKNTQKYKDAKIEHRLERPQGTSADDIGVEQFGDVNSQIDSAADDAVNECGCKTESEEDASSSERSQQALLPPVIDFTISSSVNEEDTEHSRENNLACMIGDNSEGNTDCLCNLSPGTLETATVTEPSGAEKEVGLEDGESKPRMGNVD